MVCLGPVEPSAVDQETVVFEPHGKRRFPRLPSPPAISTEERGNLRGENFLVGLQVCPTSPCSLSDEVIDHLLMLHRFCDFPVPAIHLVRTQLVPMTPPPSYLPVPLYMYVPVEKGLTRSNLSPHGETPRGEAGR